MTSYTPIQLTDVVFTFSAADFLPVIHMSAGTDASIFGYGEKMPDSNVDSSMVNKFNTNFSGTFGSDEIPTAKPYPGIGPGSFGPTPTMSGGKHRRKHKHSSRRRKHSSRKHKRSSKRGGGCGCNNLFGGKRRSHRRGLSLAMSRARSMARSRSIAGGSRRKRLILGRSGGSKRRHRGGVYQQFMSNIASTPGYAIGAPLSASTSALANPPPIQVYNHSTTPFSEADRPTHA
jgi:hypothetical protein